MRDYTVEPSVDQDKKTEKLFDQIADNFKKICTDKGINHEELIDFIGNIIQLVHPEERSDLASRLIFEIINWSSYNGYEALGIIEAVKHQYITVLDDVMEQERREAQCEGCDGCDEDDDDD